jgi:hypothetical protein
MPFEFRVYWCREGKHPKTAIYQSAAPAVQKVRTLKALDAIKDEFGHYEDMPSIVDGPTLQIREVGEWRANDYQPDASEDDVAGMREFVWYRHGEGKEPVVNFPNSVGAKPLDGDPEIPF